MEDAEGERWGVDTTSLNIIMIFAMEVGCLYNFMLHFVLKYDICNGGFRYYCMLLNYDICNRRGESGDTTSCYLIMIFAMGGWVDTTSCYLIIIFVMRGGGRVSILHVT